MSVFKTVNYNYYRLPILALLHHPIDFISRTSTQLNMQNHRQFRKFFERYCGSDFIYIPFMINAFVVQYLIYMKINCKENIYMRSD